MQPHQRRSRLSQAAASRGRMFLKAHLGFLPGYALRLEADGVQWEPLHGHGPRLSAPVRLGADELRRARRGWKTLLGRFPKALHLIVDDAAGWKAGVPRLLDLLAESVHGHAPLPPSLWDRGLGFPRSAAERAVRLARRRPGVRPLLDALGWLVCLTPGEAPSAVAWVEARAEALGQMLGRSPDARRVRQAVALWDLARRDGTRRTAPLLDVLGCPAAFETATHGARSYVTEWIELLNRATEPRAPSKWSFPQRPAADLAPAMMNLLERLSGEGQDVRRRALDLLALLLPRDLVPRWRAFWERIEAEVPAARRLVAKMIADSPQGRPLLAEVALSTAERLRAHNAQAPPELECEPGGRSHTRIWRLLTAVRDLAQPPREELCRQAIGLLRKVTPEAREHLPRVRVFWEVAEWLSWMPSAESVRILRALRTWAVPKAQLGAAICDEDFSRQFTRESVEPGPALRATAFWMGELGQSGHLDWPVLVSLGAGDPERACECLRELAAAGLDATEVYDSVLLRSAALAAPRGGIADLVRSLSRAFRKDTKICDAVGTAADWLAGGGWEGLAADAVLDGESSRLAALAARVRLARSLKLRGAPPPRPALTEPPEWARRYPAGLHESLAVLAAVDADAERAAVRLLGKDLPDAEDLGREIRSLEARAAAGPAGDRLARRLDHLRRYLREPAQPSPERLAHLDARIRRAVRRRVFATAIEELQSPIDRRLCQVLGDAQVPAWLAGEQSAEAVAAVLALEGWAGELGLRLLRRRCGPPPWRPIDEPANRAFVGRLRRMGIDPEPWLHPPGHEVVAGPGGRRVRLVFEQDPIEIFQMGAHFNTCLSPGDCNFFSTVANAADVNKHVIYARDGTTGRVVGRCLVAIADSGGLLAFQPYCHDNGLEFGRMIAGLLERLAARMKTAVVPRGAVSALVAADWYDDGSIDLGSRFACLADGSPLREALNTVEPSQLVALVEAALAPVPLNGLTLPLVVELPELDRRSELVLPLMARIEQCDGIGLEAAARAAAMAHRAGADAAARRLLRARAVPELLRRHRRHAYLDEAAMSILAQADPSSALRVLRATRPRGVRKDEQETEDNRRRLLAAAHDALGRPAQAKRLRPKRGK